MKLTELCSQLQWRSASTKRAFRRKRRYLGDQARQYS